MELIKIVLINSQIINFDGGNTSMVWRLVNKLICSALRKCVMNANTAIFIINHAKVVPIFLQLDYILR